MVQTVNFDELKELEYDDGVSYLFSKGFTLCSETEMKGKDVDNIGISNFHNPETGVVCYTCFLYWNDYGTDENGNNKYKIVLKKSNDEAWKLIKDEVEKGGNV